MQSSGTLKQVVHIVTIVWQYTESSCYRQTDRQAASIFARPPSLFGQWDTMAGIWQCHRRYLHTAYCMQCCSFVMQLRTVTKYSSPGFVVCTVKHTAWFARCKQLDKCRLLSLPFLLCRFLFIFFSFFFPLSFVHCFLLYLPPASPIFSFYFCLLIFFFFFIFPFPSHLFSLFLSSFLSMSLPASRHSSYVSLRFPLSHLLSSLSLSLHLNFPPVN
jgi:hypothetical protein